MRRLPDETRARESLPVEAISVEWDGRLIVTVDADLEGKQRAEAIVTVTRPEHGAGPRLLLPVPLAAAWGYLKGWASDHPAAMASAVAVLAVATALMPAALRYDTTPRALPTHTMQYESAPGALVSTLPATSPPASEPSSPGRTRLSGPDPSGPRGELPSAPPSRAPDPEPSPQRRPTPAESGVSSPTPTSAPPAPAATTEPRPSLSAAEQAPPYRRQDPPQSTPVSADTRAAPDPPESDPPVPPAAPSPRAAGCDGLVHVDLGQLLDVCLLD